jgi:hypothetical protein
MEAQVPDNLRNPRFGWLLVALLALLLLWPLLLNWHPFYVADSASYLRGGEAGVNTGLSMLRDWWEKLTGSSVGPRAQVDGGWNAVVAAKIAQAGGTRSLTYSLFAYLLRMPGQSLLALVVFQAAAVASLVLLTQRLLAPWGARQWQLAMIAILAVLTSASWSASTAMPDIFAGVVLLGSIALTLYLERLALAERIGLVLLLALGISAHASHLPVAAATLATGAVLRFFLRGPHRAEAVRDALWIASAPLMALAALFALSYVGFGTVSVAPKHYPFLLARSVADGPGLHYLRAHCATEKYAICEIFGTDFPTTTRKFLWEQGGVRYRATPEQMERIRAEEWTIVRNAAAEYPMLQFRSSMSNFLRQLGSFGLGKVDFRAALVKGPSGRVDLVEVTEDRPRLRAWMTYVFYAAFAASLAIIVMLRRRMTKLEGGALLVAAVGLVSNAAICGIISGVADRYQARVAWVIPLLAMLILMRIRGGEAAQPSPAVGGETVDRARTRPE